MCPALHDALRAGEPVDAAVGGMAADSLGARRIGSIAFEMSRQFVDRSVLVSESAIRDAQAALWREVRVAAEPGAAVSLAALMSGVYVPAPDEHVGVLVCGGNVALDSLQ